MAERPTIDIARLQTLVREARSEPERRRREAETAHVRTEREEAEREAAWIIAKIPVTLEAAARRGEDNAEVLVASFKDGSYFRWRIGMTTRLMGAAKIVHDFCVEQGLRVEEFEWSSANLEERGFTLVAHVPMGAADES